MIRTDRILLCNRLEKMMNGRVDRIKSHTFRESVISELKDIISEVESCLHMFDVEPTIAKAQRQECGDIFSIERVKERMKKGQEFAYSIPVNLPHQETQQLRTKALELAILSYGESIKTATSLGILTFAKTFYTYITKGE